jgi:hypothetical protein
MNRLKKALEILALPLIMVLGYGLTAVILLFTVALVGIGLSWLIALNCENLSAYVIALDVMAIVALVVIVTGGRFRAAVKELWNQIRLGI